MQRQRMETMEGSSLRERHNLKHKTTYLSPVPGEVVLIKGDSRNRGKWNIGIVETIMPSRDGVIRGVRLKTKNGYLERAVQHLYPLELRCDDESDDAKAKDNENENNLNVHAKECSGCFGTTIERNVGKRAFRASD